MVLTIVLALAAAGYVWGRETALGRAGRNMRLLHSLPSYYGGYVALWCLVPSLMVLMAWGMVEQALVSRAVLGALPPEYSNLSDGQLSLVLNDIVNLARGTIVSREPDEAMRTAAAHYTRLLETGAAARMVVVLSITAGGLAIGIRTIRIDLRARNAVEKTATVLLVACSSIAVLTTIGIVLSVLFEAIRFFEIVPLADFLFGLQWSPQMAIREGQVGSTGAFGVIPLLAGTFMISLIAMGVAAPVGLMSAIYMSEYASDAVRGVVKPVLEVLAGIPTVVYGYFAAITMGPFVRSLGESLGLEVSGESAIAAGLVMGVMIIPFVSSLSDDVINAVPQSMRDGSLGLGATHSETITRVIVPAALPGIVASLLLAVSRAIGETMIVVMAAGLSANLTANPFEAVTTVTVQIVTLLVGDQEFDSAKTLAAFALGLMLFVMTLCLNVVALYVVRRFREQYE